MKHKPVLIIAGCAVVIGAVAVGVAQGAIPLIPLPGTPAEMVPTRNQPVVQSAPTTTPQSVLDALSKAPSKPQPVEPAPSKPTYGALKNTYTDKVSGFSVKRPDELQVSHPMVGMTTIGDNKDKGFALGFCVPGSTCAGDIAQVAASARSLEDFKAGYTVTHEAGGGVPKLFEKIVPVENTTVTLANGTKVLKQSYKPAFYDEGGKDVTDTYCIECGGVHVHYILFKDKNNYLEITTGKFNDPTLETNIINSITY